MIDLIREMFAAPEAQADAYTWAAVLVAHAMIGAALVVVLTAIRPRPGACAALVCGAYGLGWEGGQLWLAGGGLADGVTDWAAVSLGAVLSAATWHHQRRVAAAAVGACALILAAGLRRRRM